MKRTIVLAALAVALACGVSGALAGEGLSVEEKRAYLLKRIEADEDYLKTFDRRWEEARLSGQRMPGPKEQEKAKKELIEKITKMKADLAALPGSSIEDEIKAAESKVQRLEAELQASKTELEALKKKKAEQDAKKKAGLEGEF